MIFPSRDIHNHLLPGVDDGFSDPVASLQAISRLASLGCREIIFSPHMNPDVYPEGSEAQFKQVYDDFVKTIPEELGVKTQLAAEYMVVAGFEERASNPEGLLVWPDGSILIEMSYYFRSVNLEETLFELNMAGLNPILAHPERYLYMAGCLQDFEKFKDMGCRFQLNLASLTGQYGRESMIIMSHLLDEGMYSFAATDLHSLAQLDTLVNVRLPRKLRQALEKAELVQMG